ncbi:MAG: ParB/RepB/Spo0J family partition protein [Acidiphilium sp.]|nr:ParB/RepB/Spo0J family partition protein [Acidiphilium sp.]MDD4937276.1 ParB/RepB/Spo0J family partition protein [Acidiphilium sp.]
MSAKQGEYLKGIIGAGEGEGAHEEGMQPILDRPRRPNAILTRTNTIERLASGELRQVTEMRLDPARCRIWKGNARRYEMLNEVACSDLIDSIIADGGQKISAIVRRVQDDPEHEFEVIVGTRRHWTISWLRKNNYPDMIFIARLENLDDEAAFRLADLENRARKDVSDLERAWNYKLALTSYYGGRQKAMAERLKITPGWLSKMLTVADLPSEIIEAFPALDSIALNVGYEIACALGTKRRAEILKIAADIRAEQANLRSTGTTLIEGRKVSARLLAAPTPKLRQEPLQIKRAGRTITSLISKSRGAMTIRIHNPADLNNADIGEAVAQLVKTVLGR